MAELANPTIAMGIAQPTSPTLANPLEILHSYADTQRAMVEAQMAQKSMAARQRAGQIIASSPDMATAIKGIQGDPLAAGYLPDIMATLQGVSTSQTEQAGSQQTQNLQGLGTLIKNIAGAGITDPAAIKGAADAALQAMNPTARAANQRSYGALVKSLTDGLDDPNMSPDTRKNAFNQRLSGIGIAAGMSADDFRSLTGAVAPQVSMQPGAEGQMLPTVTGSPNLVSPPGAHYIGGPVAPVAGPTTAQAEFLKGKGAAAGSVAQEMAQTADILPTLNRIGMMQDSLKDFQAGGGADLRTTFGRNLQALQNAGFTGVTQEQIDKVANGSLSATELFDSEVKPVVIAQLKAAAQGTGRVMRSEVDAFINSMNTTTDPKTITKLLNQARYDLQIEYDKSQKWPQYQQLIEAKDPSVSGLGPENFDSWYLHNFNPKDLPTATGGGMQIGPRPENEAKGSSPPAATKKKSLSDIFGAP